MASRPEPQMRLTVRAGVDLLWLQAGAFDCGLDDRRAEVGRGGVREAALEPADGRTRAADDDDIFHV